MRTTLISGFWVRANMLLVWLFVYAEKVSWFRLNLRSSSWLLCLFQVRFQASLHPSHHVQPCFIVPGVYAMGGTTRCAGEMLMMAVPGLQVLSENGVPPKNRQQKGWCPVVYIIFINIYTHNTHIIFIYDMNNYERLNTKQWLYDLHIQQSKTAWLCNFRWNCMERQQPISLVTETHEAILKLEWNVIAFG